MNKFITTIAGNADGIKLKRATNTAVAVKLAQEQLINTLKGNVQSLEALLTAHIDIGPESGDSLRPTPRSFDAQSWVYSLQDLKLKIKKAQEHLDVALETNEEWFGDLPATPAPAPL